MLAGMQTRRSFLTSPLALAAQPAAPPRSLKRHIPTHPLAITMWDFSWLERRWPGAGYEDWDLALDELKARGYDAVRIDAYPHLVHFNPTRTWELLPQWNTQDWGAPARCRVQVQPALNQFIAKCKQRQISVGLSTWFRQDIDDHRLKITSPELLGQAWKSTLDSIDPSLRDNILYVDLCNEFPLTVFAAFLPEKLRRASPEGVRWMRTPIDLLRAAHPQYDYTFSITNQYDTWRDEDVSMHDFLEPHLWMTHFSDFYTKLGYNYERFDPKGYDNLALHGERLYRENKAHWHDRLKHGIDFLAEWSKTVNKPLITTECWAVVDYKDFPLLNWDWILELCDLGTRHAAAHGRWIAISTSNFCGPQFRGMWRETAWHQQMTKIIHSARLPAW